MPLALLDRDGTLNREQSFVTAPKDLVMLPRATAALRRLVAAGFTPVVVTSQSGIARGLYDQTTLTRIHEAMQLACEGLIAGFFHCPHHPKIDGPYGGPCPCRKPAAGMVHHAAAVMGQPLEGAVLIGDSARDLLMGRDLPIKRILVRSGKPWRAQLETLEEEKVVPHHIADDLWDAVDWLLREPVPTHDASAPLA